MAPDTFELVQAVIRRVPQMLNHPSPSCVLALLAVVAVPSPVRTEDSSTDDHPCSGAEGRNYLTAFGSTEREITIYSDPSGGAEFTVTARAFFDLPVNTSWTDAIYGYSICVAHDPEVLELVEINGGSTDAGDLQLISVQTRRLAAVDNETGSGFVDIFVMFSDGCSFPSRRELSLVDARYRVRDLRASIDGDEGSSPFETTIHFRNGLRFDDTERLTDTRYFRRGESLASCTEPLAVRIVTERVPFVRGDANADHRVDIADPVTTLNFLFGGDWEVRCADAADVDDNGELDISDAILELSFLFLGGRPPVAPFDAPDLDPTPDALECLPF
jgi:hypothetical protein